VSLKILTEFPCFKFFLEISLACLIVPDELAGTSLLTAKTRFSVLVNTPSSAFVFAPSYSTVVDSQLLGYLKVKPSLENV